MTPSETDEQLLQRFVKGDATALGDLADRFEVPLLGLAQGLLGRHADLARDAVQDCWVRVIRYGKGFEYTSTVRTWLYRIVINRCRDLVERRQNALRTNGSLPAALLASGHAFSGFPEAEDDRDGLSKAVDRLSPAHRLVVLLCYHRALTHEQAADVIGIPVGTLKSRLSAALETLRSTLTQERYA